MDQETATSPVTSATGDTDPDGVRTSVRRRYGAIAVAGEGGCGCATDCCANSPSLDLGYRPEDLAALPDGADLGLGCGNPQALAGLRPGEVVLDLGSGAGIDCFLAAPRVAPGGRVIGVDMTPEMVTRARDNARHAGFDHVEFRLGEIEHLPVADHEVDVIISNCVINLSPNKAAVFLEAARVLRPGGRLAIADVIAVADIPAEALARGELYGACVTGATSAQNLTGLLASAGFHDVRVTPKAESATFMRQWSDALDVTAFVVSATIEARTASEEPPR